MVFSARNFLLQHCLPDYLDSILLILILGVQVGDDVQVAGWATAEGLDAVFLVHGATLASVLRSAEVPLCSAVAESVGL